MERWGESRGRGGAWIWATALVGTSCMTNPTNGDELATTTETVTFAGYQTKGGGAVLLESASSREGPYHAFARATARTNGIPINGDMVYPWSTSAVVPSWGSTACGSEAYVRARNGTSWYFLLTYDNPADEDGTGGLTCLGERLGLGEPVLIAATECASKDSPVVRLTSGGSTHVGDVTVSTQAEADAFACARSIEGSLTIADDPSELSISFPRLETVTGDLDVTYSTDGVLPIPTVRTVDLPRLTTVGHDVDLHYLGDGVGTAYVDVGLPALNSVGRNVTVTADTFNLNLKGIPTLVEIPGDLTVLSTGSEFVLGGFLRNVLGVAGNVHLEGGGNAFNVLPRLQTVGMNLIIRLLDVQPGRETLSSLLSVGGDLVFDGTQITTVPDAGNHLPVLNTVRGRLDAHDAGMSDLLIGDDSGLSLGSLSLTDMDTMTALTATWITVMPEGSVTITGNTRLTDCAAQSFVTAIGWAGTPTIAGNGPC